MSNPRQRRAVKSAAAKRARVAGVACAACVGMVSVGVSVCV